MKKDGYNIVSLSFSRRAVIASASVTKDKNAIHVVIDEFVPSQIMLK